MPRKQRPNRLSKKSPPTPLDRLKAHDRLIGTLATRREATEQAIQTLVQLIDDRKPIREMYAAEQNHLPNSQRRPNRERP